MSKFDSIIAIGGGSVMDIAKVAIAFMGTGINKIIDIPKDIIKYSLSEWGIKKGVLPSLVEQSFTKDRMEKNIKDLSKDDVEIIL